MTLEFHTHSSWEDEMCHLKIELESSLEMMETNKECHESLIYMQRNALAEAWGSPWGKF